MGISVELRDYKKINKIKFGKGIASVEHAPRRGIFFLDFSRELCESGFVLGFSTPRRGIERERERERESERQRKRTGEKG